MHVGCSDKLNQLDPQVKVLVPTMHVGCSEIFLSSYYGCSEEVLVPTMHVGCSPDFFVNQVIISGFSTHDARGL